MVRIVDISQGFYAGMPAYTAAWYPRFAVESVMTPENDPAGAGRTFTRLQIFAHNATHVDAPRHFFPRGATTAGVPLTRLIGPALVADLSGKGDGEPVTAADLARAVGDDWRPGLRLLVRTDYHHRRWGAPDYWQAAPYLDPSAARWIAAAGAALVGIDCQTERPGERDFPVHRILLGEGVPILEYLTNLHLIPERQVYLVALPLKLEGVEAAPVRAVVLTGDLSSLADAEAVEIRDG